MGLLVSGIFGKKHLHHLENVMFLHLITIPETNIVPETLGLEDEFWKAVLAGAM